MFSITCFVSPAMPPSASVNVPGRLPICPERYKVSPTFTASENGRFVGSTLPEFKRSGAADAVAAAKIMLAIVIVNVRIIFLSVDQGFNQARPITSITRSMSFMLLNHDGEMRKRSP